jgi:hemin uptake protein HemP
MSFMISHEGQVFEKDLGPHGDKLAESMKLFDPDNSWKEVVVDHKTQ